jgi:acyl-coenzyme A synthetase/AMP-(fatty) acid ligase
VLYLETPALPVETVGKLNLAFRTHLQRHEVPKEICCLASFPRTETGKILRGAFLQS